MAKVYTDEEVERALTTLALVGSSTAAEQECGVPNQTLRQWRRKDHAARYETIRQQLLPKIREKIAQDAEDLAIRYAEAEHQALDGLDLTQLRPADLAQALPRLATARGISTDKANVMRDRPTQITEHRPAADVLSSIARRNPGLVVDGTAIELDDDQPALPSPARYSAADSA